MFVSGGLGVRSDARLDASLYEKYDFAAASQMEGTLVYEPLHDLHLLDLGKLVQRIYLSFMAC